MTLDWRLPDESTYLTFGEQPLIIARFHPVRAFVPFFRAGVLSLIGLLMLASDFWVLGGFLMLMVLVQWARRRGYAWSLSFLQALGIAILILWVTGLFDDPAATLLLFIVVLFLIAFIQFIDYFFTKLFLTDRRIFRVSGLLTRTIGTLPLKALTDIRYDQTPVGRLLNYGHFYVESAGQDQALSRLLFVPQPKRFYRLVMQEALGFEVPDTHIDTLPPEQMPVTPPPPPPPKP
jgi:membrane protein YdbS with pleckstrin-like domain